MHLFILQLEYTRNIFGACLLQVINIATSRFTGAAWVSTGKAKQTFGSPLQTTTLYSTGLPNLAKQWQMFSLFSGLIFVAHCFWKLVCRRPVCASPWVFSPPSGSRRRSLGSLWRFFLWQYPSATIIFNNTRVDRQRVSGYEFTKCYRVTRVLLSSDNLLALPLFWSRGGDPQTSLQDLPVSEFSWFTIRVLTFSCKNHADLHLRHLYFFFQKSLYKVSANEQYQDFCLPLFPANTCLPHIENISI